jgi:hypothetical protein
MMAVSRKLVPSSPVRNLVRRVIRESHRHACQAQPAGSDQRDSACLQPEASLLCNWSLRIQLVGIPHDPAAPQKDARGQAIKAFKRRWPDRQLKRLLRADIDSLLGSLSARLLRSGR